MRASPIGKPIAGRMMMVGHGAAPKSLTPAAVAMMTATKQMIDRPTADAIMNARTRSPRCALIGEF